MLSRRKPITIRTSLIRSFVVLILMSSLSILILMSIRAYRTEQELSEKLIRNGSRQAEQELDRFFQPAKRGTLIGAYWGQSGKLTLNKLVAGRPGKVTKAQRRAATRLNTLLLPLLLQLPEVSSVQVATARGDGFLILQLPSGHIRNRVVSRERWGVKPCGSTSMNKGSPPLPSGKPWIMTPGNTPGTPGLRAGLTVRCTGQRPTSFSPPKIWGSRLPLNGRTPV